MTTLRLPKMILYSRLRKKLEEEIYAKWKAWLEKMLDRGYITVFLKIRKGRVGMVYLVKVSDRRVKPEEFQEIGEKLDKMFPNIEFVEYEIGNSWYGDSE